MTDFDIVVYHINCSDGMASQWCVLQNNMHIRSIPCKAGDIKSISIDNFIDKRVLFVDMCPNYDELESIKTVAKIITILDHHKSALDMCKQHYGNIDDNLFVKRCENIIFNLDMSKAGCQITWDYFFPAMTRPWFVDYIADRDLWLFKLNDSKAINAGLFVANKININDMNKMVSYSNSDVDEIKEIGLRHLKKIDNIHQNICNTAVEATTTINNKTYNVWLVSCEAEHKSEVGSILSRKTLPSNRKPDFAAIWKKDPNSNDYWISMRNQNSGVDLSVLSQEYSSSGGGHSCAAGFTIKEPQTLDSVFNNI